MQIVIEIPEVEYERMKAYTGPMAWAEYLIVKGTPLPEGHGDLKDVSKLHYESGVFLDNKGKPLPVVHKMATIEVIRDWLPIVIDADKGDEE